MLTAVVIISLIIIFFYFVSNEIGLKKKRISLNKEILIIKVTKPKEKTINAIKSIWSNENFLLDFKNILNDLSIDVKSIDQLTIFKYRNHKSIENKHWELVNSEHFIYPEIIDKVINKLSHSASFNKIKKDYEFFDDDEIAFFKLITIYITLSDFSELSQKWIFKTVDKNMNENEPDICKSIFDINL
jgi:hypothetical protein